MFEIKNISKKYNNEFALKDISLDIGKGLNFIVGASGSGKTTLLKIISGMDSSFEGDVFYKGKSVKNLSENEKSYFYNNVFGFVWQDFNLIEELTVLENVCTPQYLKDTQNKAEIAKVLRQLKISELAEQKVNKLSGGQKQRVAIARELVKNPEVIIADEPTSALDEKTSKSIMDILRDIAKTRTVIIVTHDLSHVDSKSSVFELDKGELISKPNNEILKSPSKVIKSKHKLSIKNALKLASVNYKSKLSKFLISSVAFAVSATLLLVSLSGLISNTSQSAFDELFNTYGDGILDISIITSFMSAAGGDEDKPNADVTQNIGGLYDKYLNDSRVEHIVLSQAFDDIKVNVDGKEYDIDFSGNTPVLNKLIAGKMPMGNGNEVVIPDSLVKKMGLTNEDILGKEINFQGSIYNWDSGEPILMPTTITATIVGVIDTTVIYDYEGQIGEFTVDDSFFFSKSAVIDMRNQAEILSEDINFIIRANTPADMISIKDELNADGIVPLGRFELVEDMVRLNQQTTEQSGSATIVIGMLSVVVSIAIAMITAFMRRREYAIYKVSGFNNVHLSILNIAESFMMCLSSITLFLLASPIIIIATKKAFNAEILDAKLLSIGCLLVILVVAICYIISTIISSTTVASKILKTGDK